jgi:hypothetical protein
MRTCQECGAPVGLRRTRCAECRRKYRAKLERDRVARNKATAGAELQRYGPDTELSTTVDYSKSGVKASGPGDWGSPYKTRPVEPAADVAIDYTQPGDHRSVYDRPAEYNPIPASVRHDHVAYQRRLGAMNSDADWEARSMPWHDLAAVQAAYQNPAGPRIVDFSRRASDVAGPLYDSLGRPTRRNRGGLR